jgi:hypothetical protein
MSGRPEQRMSWALAAMASLWLVFLTLAGIDGALLYLAPAVLMAVPLFCGRYPAERALVRLASRRRRPPRLARDAPPKPPLMRRSPGRGARLIAHSLAGRAPPGPAVFGE